MRAPISRLVPTARTLAFSALVAAGALLGMPRARGGEPSRPNVLLLLADDQRADTIAA